MKSIEPRKCIYCGKPMKEKEISKPGYIMRNLNFHLECLSGEYIEGVIATECDRCNAIVYENKNIYDLAKCPNGCGRLASKCPECGYPSLESITVCPKCGSLTLVGIEGAEYDQRIIDCGHEH